MAFTFINDIENCKKWVSPETLARFATFFGVPVSAFFSNEVSVGISVSEVRNTRPLRYVGSDPQGQNL